MVSGSPASACVMNCGTARPSSLRMRGPYVLKMRTIRVSTPRARRYAITYASAARLASSYTLRGPTEFTLPQYDSGCGCTKGSPYTSGRRQQEHRPLLARELQRVARAGGADVEGVNGAGQVVGRR